MQNGSSHCKSSAGLRTSNNNMSPDMILMRAVSVKPMAPPRQYFSGIEKNSIPGVFQGLSVIDSKLFRRERQII